VTREVDKVAPGRQVRQIVTATVASLVLASLSFTAAYAWGDDLHHHFAPPARAAFTISSAIYTAPPGAFSGQSCTGSPVLLYPGVTRCMVFSVHNDLSRPITVENITSSLSPAFPAPPAVCSGSNLRLPAFSGALAVPAGATVVGPGLLISLKESHSNQDACVNLTYHFSFTGTATLNDATFTVLTSSYPSPMDQPVTFAAVVAVASAGPDSSRPPGLVTFSQCPTSVCTTSTRLGTGSIGVSGHASYTTKDLLPSVTYVQAAHGGTNNDLIGSTSNVDTQFVRSTLTVTSPTPEFLPHSVFAPRGSNAASLTASLAARTDATW
jgi:hypothetical protein